MSLDPAVGQRSVMKPGLGLWIGVAVGFGLLTLAWAALFYFASQARVKTVPLAPHHPAASPAGTNPSTHGG